MSGLKDNILGIGDNLNLEGVSIGSASYHLLVVQDDSNISEHLNVQSAAYAYFAVLCNEAKAELEKAQNQFNLWKSQTYQIVSAELALKKTTGRAPTQKDVDSAVDTQYEDKTNEWRERVAKAVSDYETLKVWIQAWQMKENTILEISRSNRKSGGDNFTSGRDDFDNGSELKKAEDLLRNKGKK